MPTKIQFKRGLNENLNTATLSAGEPAFVTDTGKLYVGDGTTKVMINPIDKPSGLDVTNSFTKVKVNEYGQIVTQSNLTASDIPSIPYTQVTGLGTAATKDVGISVGNVPVLDSSGKLAASTLPAIAITDTFIVSSQAEMLALDANVGDIAVRSDLNQTFILKTAPATAIANWVELLTPTDAVISVNGQVGVVVLAAPDIDMTGYTKAMTYTAIEATDNSSVAIGKLEKNFDNYADLVSPAFSGSPTAVTQATADNSTRLATTAHVKANLASYAPINSPTFTGSPVAPTPATTDNSTALATTAFVQSIVAVIDGGTF